MSLVFADVSFAFKGRRDTRVLERLSLEVDENEFVTVVGASGVGKSTIIELAAGFLRADSGRVSFASNEVTAPDGSRVVVFQEDAVFPWMTVSQNIQFGMKGGGTARAGAVAEYLSLVELEDVAKKYPRELSGGMRKRVDVARALASEASLILMDEPFSALDTNTKRRLHRDFQFWIERKGRTVLFVTHDIEEALWLSDRVVVVGGRPASVCAEYVSGWPRPRRADLVYDQDFVDLRREIEQNIFLDRK